MDTSKLTLRQLQTESARALSTMQATNNNIYKFNKQAQLKKSQNWYIAVIDWYVNTYGDLILAKQASEGYKISIRCIDLKILRKSYLEVTPTLSMACPMCDLNMNGGADNPT